MAELENCHLAKPNETIDWGKIMNEWSDVLLMEKFTVKGWGWHHPNAQINHGLIKSEATRCPADGIT